LGSPIITRSQIQFWNEICKRSNFSGCLHSDPDSVGRLPIEVWQQDWVVHIESVGNGENALKYLAPYIYRIAISNSNILRCVNGYVTFRYKDSTSHQTKTMTVTAMEFMRRYLQHVLPKGFPSKAGL